MGKKRTNDGKEKLAKAAQQGRRTARDTALPNDTPPGAQAPKSSTTDPATEPSQNSPQNAKKKKLAKSNDSSSSKPKRKKLPKLPPNATVSKRPLHHPSIPTPFLSSDHPKTLYLTHSTPFIPTLKRIRRLLLEISKRRSQSEAQLSSYRNRNQQRRTRKPLEPNGRLAPEDVEREIAEEGRDKGGGVGDEEVFVKATGRAIERALRVGVYFQGESEWKVRVEMGSVMAVDDVEVRPGEEDGGNAEDEDVPETRVRMVSSVTVAIGLK